MTKSRLILALGVFCFFGFGQVAFADEFPKGADIWQENIFRFDVDSTSKEADCIAYEENLSGELRARYSGQVGGSSLDRAADMLVAICSFYRTERVIRELEARIEETKADFLEKESELAWHIADRERINDLKSDATSSDLVWHERSISLHDKTIKAHKSTLQAHQNSIEGLIEAISSLKADQAYYIRSLNESRELSIGDDERVLVTLDPKAQEEWLRKMLGGGGGTAL